MKTLLVTGLSVVLSAAVIGNAYYQKKQFYPSVVYITKSNPSMAGDYDFITLIYYVVEDVNSLMRGTHGFH
uniref:E3 ubiquitin-protein ligase HRD1 n=1 Tax=Magallana gigas TaxID=29159 RepID=K1QT14_MAGGI